MTVSQTLFGRGFLGGALDLIAGALVALLLSGTLGRWFAERAVIMLSIGSPDTSWSGPVPMLLGIFGNLVYTMPFSLVIVLLAEALFGAGPGKWLLGMQVAARDGSPAPARRRLLRWSVKCSGPALLLLALVSGEGLIAAVGVGALTAALAGFFVPLSTGRRALHDRVSGTAVTSAGRE